MYSHFPLLGFIFGAMVGSFANVCIYRLPLSLNIVSPGSHCGKCKTFIRWYENIPILSFLVLRGRCRHCGISIGWIHPIIEATCGLFLMISIYYYGLSLMSLYIFLMLTGILILSMIDFQHRIIPDSFSIGGMFLGLALALLCQWAGKPWPIQFKESILGVVVGGGFLWAIAWIYEKVTGREGMGFGDVKLVAFFGAHMGWQGAMTSIFLGSLLGSTIGLLLILIQKKNRRTVIPFGPFLSIGFLIYFLDALNIVHFPLEWLGSYGF